MNTKRIAFTLILSLLIAVSFSSCKKEEIEEDYPTHHIGKWQLVAADYSTGTGEPVSADYSQANIVYDFRENNVLIVSGEIEDVEDYRGHERGEHSYKAFPIPTFSLAEFKIGTDTLTYYYRFGNTIGTRLLPLIDTHMLLSYHNKRASLDLVRIEE